MILKNNDLVWQYKDLTTTDSIFIMCFELSDRKLLSRRASIGVLAVLNGALA